MVRDCIRVMAIGAENTAFPIVFPWTVLPQQVAVNHSKKQLPISIAKSSRKGGNIPMMNEG